MNYFEYFTEIEDRFLARRGSLLLLSTLDWALIESWREAGVPLAAVLQGIDDAFEKYDQRKARSRGRLGKVNGLAWCAQAVMQAASEMADAAIGGRREEASSPRQTGFEAERIASFLEKNAAILARASAERGASAAPLREVMDNTGQRLRQLAAALLDAGGPPLDELDRILTVLDEQLRGALLASVSETDLLAAREAADRDLLAARAKMSAVQVRQVREQYIQKRVLESSKLPRLSLFYMPLEEDGEAA